jgi:hypothetical protein
MKPIQFLTRAELDAAYAKVCKKLPIPQITEDHERHLVETMLRTQAKSLAKNIIGHLKGEFGWSNVNIQKDAKNYIDSYRNSEKWRLWQQSIGASFCERRQKWIVTNL